MKVEVTDKGFEKNAELISTSPQTLQPEMYLLTLLCEYPERIIWREPKQLPPDEWNWLKKLQRSNYITIELGPQYKHSGKTIYAETKQILS